MEFTDQLGQVIKLAHPPRRIVSLVPSQTELLFALGLKKQIVGITKFCIHPRPQVKGIPKIGGTKNFRVASIRQLQPDLIIGNKEENYPAGIYDLAQEFPVWVSDINNLPDALAMIENIGQITGTTAAARNITQAIKLGFAGLPTMEPIPAAYFIWKNPYMSVGHDTFIHQMLQTGGFQNVFGNLNRYPIITPEDLQAAAPRVIFLSSEPYPFREKHLHEIQQIVPTALVTLVNGELFSWYGSRLLYTPAYLKTLHQTVTSALLTD